MSKFLFLAATLLSAVCFAGGSDDGALFRYLHFGHRSIVATALPEIDALLAD